MRVAPSVDSCYGVGVTSRRTRLLPPGAPVGKVKRGLYIGTLDSLTTTQTLPARNILQEEFIRQPGPDWVIFFA